MTAEVFLRAARIEDLPAIAIIRTSVRENHLSVEQLAERGITEESIAARMRSGNLGAWVTTIDAEITAFAMADKTTGNIFALFTHPDHEGKGCGSVLLTRCEGWLRQQGVKSMILDTAQKSKAVAFYAKRGWVEYDRDKHEISMSKKLDPTSPPQPRRRGLH
jgi:GNAT superfamily N-acetyltransferase